MQGESAQSSPFDAMKTVKTFSEKNTDAGRCRQANFKGQQKNKDKRDRRNTSWKGKKKFPEKKENHLTKYPVWPRKPTSESLCHITEVSKKKASRKDVGSDKTNVPTCRTQQVRESGKREEGPKMTDQKKNRPSSLNIAHVKAKALSENKQGVQQFNAGIPKVGRQFEPG